LCAKKMGGNGRRTWETQPASNRKLRHERKRGTHERGEEWKKKGKMPKSGAPGEKNKGGTIRALRRKREDSSSENQRKGWGGGGRH